MQFPFSEIKSPKTPFLNTHTTEEKRAEILHYFTQTYKLYENLFSLIKEDLSYYSKPEPLRHPLIFYLGHTAVFYINKLLISKNITQRVHPSFESIFAIGVDEMTWDDLDERNYEWPPLAAVWEYRKNVFHVVTEFIKSMPLELPIKPQDPAWIVLMGIEHERIHLETSSVIIRQLPLEEVQTQPQWPICPQSSQEFLKNTLIEVQESFIQLGKSDPTYGWDNEYGEQTQSVKPFQASQMLVSNGEFFEFVLEEGYHKKAWWSDEGWSWRKGLGVSTPRFWKSHNGEYYLRTLAEEIPMPWNWPVEVNYFEAKAFCQWKSQKEDQPFRLPTEAEWQVLREKVPGDITTWEKVPGNLHLEFFASPCPVDLFPQNKFYDIVGNVWQWTETPIEGFEGFKVHPAYDDFSVPTFDGDHHLIKGGSWISTGNEALKSARYAFRKHFYQHAGFRYVQAEPLSDVHVKKNSYETDEQVSQYLEFHYGEEYFQVPNFPKACVKQLLKNTPDLKSRKKALDLGCAVGRSTFELAQHFDQVVGMDFTARFIEKAVQLQEQGRIPYAITTEGELKDYKEVTLSALQLDSIAKKIEFWQGDACNLKPQFTDFDLIFCGNLIDRLYDPKKFLMDMKKRLNPGGYLVLTSPYTWLEEFTDKDKWLGGFKEMGENKETLLGLQEVLTPEFQLKARLDIPFVIRETRRKFQHTLSEMTVWQIDQALV